MAKIQINNPKQIINGGAKKYYFKVKGLGGPKGDKGDTGETGPQGPQGPQGNAATVYVGSTTTLPVGQDATVENVGTQYNAVLNFGIPQGPRGPQGATGAKGDKGDKGEQGNPGPQGEKGTNATVTVGTTTTTEPGTKAYAWNSSSNPNNAVINFNIPRGATGSQGPQGVQGPTGPAGADGESFTPVVVSSLPPTGAEGKLYLTPKAHTTQTATGNPITATVAEEAGAIESFQLDGDTFQQTYTGKNLFAPPVGDSASGVTFTLNADGTYDISGTATARAQIVLFLDTPWLENGEIYTIKANQPLGDVMARVEAYSNTSYLRTNYVLDSTSQQQTGAWNGKNVTKCCFVLRVESGKTVNISGLGIQLEKGSTATSFEKFVGGQPSPNPDYPQPIQTVTGEQTVEIVGKNLFDGITTNQVILSDGTIADNNSWDLSGFIKVEPNTAYTVSFKLGPGGSHSILVPQFDGDKGFLARWGSQSTAPYTFTTGSTTGFIRLNYNNTNNDTDFQIEAGSTASAYEPYSSTNYPLNLGDIELCGLGDDGNGNPLYKDYIYPDGDEWKIHKENTKATFNGTEAGWNATVQTAPYFINLAERAFGNYCDGISTHFKNRKAYPSNAGEFAIRTEGNTISFNKGGLASLDEWLSWLGSNNVTAYYPLALGLVTDTTITDTTLIAQLEAIRTASLENGTNTITNTATGSNLAGDMKIGYYGYNPTNRYDKFIWLDLNNAYEQLNNPDTSSTLSTLSTRSLGATTEQPTVTRSLETGTITLKKGETEPIEDKTELPTILDEEAEEAEETETTEPEESDGTDER